LLTELAIEAHLRFDREPLARGLALRGHVFPVGHRQDGAEVTRGQLITVQRTGVAVAAFAGPKVGDDLVAAKKVQVEPVRRAAALRAAEQASVEAARSASVVDREGEAQHAVGAHGGLRWALAGDGRAT